MLTCCNFSLAMQNWIISCNNRIRNNSIGCAIRLVSLSSITDTSLETGITDALEPAVRYHWYTTRYTPQSGITDTLHGTHHSQVSLTHYTVHTTVGYHWYTTRCTPQTGITDTLHGTHHSRVSLIHYTVHTTVGYHSYTTRCTPQSGISHTLHPEHKWHWRPATWSTLQISRPTTSMKWNLLGFGHCALRFKYTGIEDLWFLHAVGLNTGGSAFRRMGLLMLGRQSLHNRTSQCRIVPKWETGVTMLFAMLQVW